MSVQTSVGAVEYPKEMAECLFDELPAAGEIITVSGQEHIITGVTVVNESKLVLKLSVKRDVRHIEKVEDFDSIDAEPLSFLGD